MSSLRNSESLELELKREKEDSSSFFAVKLENDDLVGNNSLFVDGSHFIEPEIELKTEPEIFESSDGDMKHSYDCDVSVSEEDLQSCQKEINKEDESVNAYLWTEIGLKEECDKGEVIEEVEQIKEEKIESNDCDRYVCQEDDPKTYTDDMRENYGKQFSGVINLNTRVLIDTEGQFICKECGEIFFKQSDLIVHHKNHTLEKPFKCNVCDKAYFEKGNLTKHHKIHTEEKQFKCSYCGKMFFQKSDLTAHHRIHTGERPFKCSVCDHAFSQKSHLTKHYRIHTGEKPNKCSVCDKAFSQRSDLTKHYRIHTGEKPFKCDVCDQAFAQRSGLTSHYSMHTGKKPFKCTVCDKAFSQRSCLTKHNRIHTGEKPFKCSVCDKAFSERSDLTKHYRIHTGEKPFKCNVCDKAFSLRSNLTIHYRIHNEKYMGTERNSDNTYGGEGNKTNEEKPETMLSDNTSA